MRELKKAKLAVVAFIFDLQTLASGRKRGHVWCLEAQAEGSPLLLSLPA